MELFIGILIGILIIGAFVLADIKVSKRKESVVEKELVVTSEPNLTPEDLKRQRKTAYQREYRARKKQEALLKEKQEDSILERMHNLDV